MLSKERGKRLYIVIIIVFLTLLSGFIFYKVKKHNFLDHQLQDVVQKKTDQLYRISYDSISVDELGGDIYIKNLYIKGDTARQMELIRNKDTNAAPIILDIYVPLLKVVAFKTVKALISKQMECKQIVISNPKVHVYLFPGQSNKSNDQKKQEQLYKQLLGNFKLIKADSISVINGDVTASDFSTKEIKFHTANTTVNLSQLAIDSTYNQDTTRTLFCKAIAVGAERVTLGDKKNTAEIEKATFNTRSKIVAFSSISYDAFKNGGFFKTRLQGILLGGIEWLGPADNSELVIDKATVEKGDLETLSNSADENKKQEKKEKKILTGWLRRFALKTLQVKSVDYTSRTNVDKSNPLIIKNGVFSLENVEIDRTAAFNGQIVNHAKEIAIKNSAISMKSGNNWYQYKASGILLNTKTNTLRISSFRIVPQLGEEAFVKKARYQTDRFDVLLKDFRADKVDAAKLVKGEIDIGNITTTGNSIKVFRDLSYPVDSAARRRQRMTFPHQLLHQIGIPIKISKFSIADTYIEYKEKNEQSHKSGRVRFSKTYMVINNISTYKAKPGATTVVNFKSTFLDQIPVTGEFNFSQDKWQKGNFSVDVSVVNDINALVLNQLTEPMSLVRMEKGTINSIEFSMKADTSSSSGTLVMPYHDLKISLLKKKGDEYVKKGIFSALANLAVKNNNNDGEHMRIAKVTYTRNIYNSFFDFIWMTIFKGIKNVAVLKI